MTAAEVMKLLEGKGKPNTAKIYARHGVREPLFGVSYADLGELTKKLKANQGLAEQLWASGNHDARVLAAKIADPERMSAKMLDAWVEDCSNYIISDAVSALAVRLPAAMDLASRWRKSSHEWTAAAGWNIVAILATEKRYPEAAAKADIARIQKEIHKSPNRVRHSMNNALIAIGIGLDALREAAVQAAKSIGKVEVDHGETGCKTPDAVSYLEKAAARAASRTRVTGAKMKASKSAK
ncbi:MAG: hypothetical protein GMKNLPBB_00123 [Myxococcota bacterium]|nr:hypothetical protein [Myxococcota bacterium]